MSQPVVQPAEKAAVEPVVLPSVVRADALSEPGPTSQAEIFNELPKLEVSIVLLIDFLNSYRSFGLSFVQYAYVTNDFGLTDIDAGWLLSWEALCKVVFGFSGAILVDIYGVRRTALVALSVAMVSRGILVLGRSRELLYMALLLLTPFGEALLSMGIYTVALKKLTTQRTRALAFGIQYGVSSAAGGCAGIVASASR